MQSNEEFLDVVTAFYLHMARHVSGVEEPPARARAAGEAYALLERAFAQKGGVGAACAEARDGVRGGLRVLLDTLTAQFKTEEQEKHVNMVFKEALSTMEYPERLAVVTALVEHLGPHLPAEIRSSPPDRYVQKVDILVRIYVQSLDTVKGMFRNL